ncbi:MAG TPA: Ig-like domain repeat protein, partial [Thermoanaerobaculia bacterium]|nr:Ig-like domain repeat protein [Thermoanaerobaculia bacterium]
EVTHAVSIGPSGVDVSVPDRSGAIGRTVSLQAHVARSSDGSPRASTKVVFEIGGNPAGADVTNASGDATVSVKLISAMGIGRHAVTARTGGDPDYKAGSGSGTITIGASER